MKSRILVSSLALSLMLMLIAGGFVGGKVLAEEKAATAKVTFSIPGMQ